MKRYLPYLKLLIPVKWHLAGGIIAGLIFAAATGAGVPLATETIFPLIFPDDTAGADKETTNWLTENLKSILGDVSRQTLVFIACLWLPGMFLVRAVSGFINSYLISYCGFRVLEKIRNDVFTKLQSLPISFFSQHQSGDLLARLTGDAELLRSTITRIAKDIIKQPFTLISAMGFLVYQAVEYEGTFFVIVSICTIPICVMPLRMIARKMGKKARSLQENAGDLSGQIAETLQAPMEIRAYNLQERVIERFQDRVREIIRFSMKVVKYRQLVGPSVEFVAVLGFTIALVIGSQQEDVMSLTRFMAIGLALYLSYEPVKKLGEIHSLMKQGEASLDRLEMILDAPDKIEESDNPRRPDSFVGTIDFENVVFGYEEEDVLKGINLSIK
ncbi:ABC transporter ATP-binding protein, partial [Akkermansiaceae bacterium]|nr:ABC transporter ATP-binding protein [Akkermansiaceae bacterium]